MKTYTDLRAEIQRLEVEAEKLRAQEKGGVVARIREAIDVYGITADDLGLSASKSPRSAAKAPGGKSVGVARYRDPETGKTWTGRGKPPAWLAGKDRSAFEVAATGSTGSIKVAAGAGGVKPKRKVKGAGVAKYRDAASGKTWTGRGKPPAWIAGAQNRDDYLIKA